MEDCKCKHEQEIQEMKNTIYGNGRPGLKESVVRLDETVKTLNSTVEEFRKVTSAFHKFQDQHLGGEKQKKKTILILTISISTIITLIGFIINILMI